MAGLKAITRVYYYVPAPVILFIATSNPQRERTMIHSREWIPLGNRKPDASRYTVFLIHDSCDQITVVILFFLS